MTRTTLNPSSTAPAALSSDAEIISLIGLAHGTSHFFHMLLPPFFPVFMREFGLSYSELGLLVTAFFVISGLGQALAGFLVDRTGARPVLFAALGCFALASLAAGLATGMGGLLLAAALAGLGNAPFHPVDFTILNKRVSAAKLGHAYSAHGISGNLGWAAAPVFLLGVSAAFGGWRWAYLGTALWAVAVMVLLAWRRTAIDDRLGSWAPPASSSAKSALAVRPDEHPLAFLCLPSVWLCFSFFFFTTVALSAIQSFSSPALEALYGLPVHITAFVVTGYMLCGAAGMVLGGFLVARAEALERQIGLAMAGAAVMLVLAATGWLPPIWGAAAVAFAGFGTGIAGPSRDMLIKRAAPPGATGRVYGTVYSGLDVGYALAAPVFGTLMDRGHPGAVFYGSALALIAGIVAAIWVRGARRSPAPTSA